MAKIKVKTKAKAINKRTLNKGSEKCTDPLVATTITPKKGGIKSKKEKISEKRKNLMNKFSILKKLQKEERDRKNREKTAVIGDLKPLKDALPSLDEMFKLTKEKDSSLRTGIQGIDDAGKEEKKLSAKKKIKIRKEKFVRQVNSYQKLLKDLDFKKNPREVIRFHIKYTHGLAE